MGAAALVATACPCAPPADFKPLIYATSDAIAAVVPRTGGIPPAVIAAVGACSSAAS